MINEPINTPSEDEINAYFNYNASTGSFTAFTNNDLICRDCKYLQDSLTSCSRYIEKPGPIFYNEFCEKYEKHDT